MSIQKIQLEPHDVWNAASGALSGAGMFERYDVAALKEHLLASTTTTLDTWVRRDARGATHARHVFAKLEPVPDVLGLVLVDDAHIPVIAREAASYGFAPHITSALGIGNLERGSRSLSSGKGQRLLATVIGAEIYYALRPPVTTDAQGLGLIGASDAVNYALALPTAGALRKCGMRYVHVFVERLPRGHVALGDLTGGGIKRQLAGVLASYVELGLAVEATGLETPDFFEQRELPEPPEDSL